MIEDKIRRVAVSSNVEFPAREPYAVANVLRVNEGGVYVEVISRTIKGLEGTIRQKVFRTLEENGIPNETVEVDPQVWPIATEYFKNQNPAMLEQGMLRGYRRVFSFALTPAAKGWFATEEGEIHRVLQLV